MVFGYGLDDPPIETTSGEAIGDVEISGVSQGQPSIKVWLFYLESIKITRISWWQS